MGPFPATCRGSSCLSKWKGNKEPARTGRADPPWHWEADHEIAYCHRRVRGSGRAEGAQPDGDRHRVQLGQHVLAVFGDDIGLNSEQAVREHPERRLALATGLTPSPLPPMNVPFPARFFPGPQVVTNPGARMFS